MDSPEFLLSYGAYAVKSDAGVMLKEAIAQCDNAITLMEAARELQEAEDEIAARKREISARVDALYNLTLAVVA
jgi:hypothetical protein